MKNQIQTIRVALLLPLAALAVSGCCSSSSCGSKAECDVAGLTAVEMGVPGGASMETYTQTARVTDIDQTARTMKMVTPEGKVVSYKAGPEVINFDQIEMGDQVKVVLVEQVLVFARKAGSPSDDGAASVFVKAPAGEKPAVMTSTSEEIVAKVKSIDLDHHKATLEFPDGKSKTFSVRHDVDMTQYAIGDEVVFRTTESLAVSVEKP